MQSGRAPVRPKLSKDADARQSEQGCWFNVETVLRQLYQHQFWRGGETAHHLFWPDGETDHHLFWTGVETGLICRKMRYKIKRKSGENAQIGLKMAGAGWRGSPALRHDFPRLCSELRSHKICSPQTFLAPQAAKTVSVHLNTCLNTTFLVSTPVSTPLFSSQHLRTNTSLPVSTPGSLTPKAVSTLNHRPCCIPPKGINTAERHRYQTSNGRFTCTGGVGV